MPKTINTVDIIGEINIQYLYERKTRHYYYER